MKTKWYVCMVVSMLLLVNAVTAEEQKRTATILDTAGVTTEVTELHVSLDPDRYGLDYPVDSGLVVKSEFLEIAIRFDDLISVTRTEKTVVASYFWNGRQLTAEGNLTSGDMIGKSVFGSFKMKTDGIKTLQFKEPPPKTTEPKKTEPLIAATLELADGASMPVVDLKRVFEFESSSPWSWNRYTNTANSPDIPFMRGESTATVQMKDLAKVDFGPDAAITVLLKSGTTGSGKLSSEKDGIIGFCGTCKKGHLFIELKGVKTIDFSKGQPLSK